jgi:hypothetical protein
LFFLARVLRAASIVTSSPESRPSSATTLRLRLRGAGLAAPSSSSSSEELGASSAGALSGLKSSSDDS